MSKKYKRFAHWSNREVMDLASGIQKYGYTDLQKISTVVKTKSAMAIKAYILHRINEVRKTKKKLEKETTGRKVKNSWNVKNTEDVKNWREVRKWHKVLENQMPHSAAQKDYSRIAIKNVCQQFYDEAEETTNPQELDVKSIYKFILECVSGEVPGQLAIKESTYVLLLLRLLKDMFQRCDISEELKFIHEFQKPLEFVPARIKDEFKKGVVYDPGTVPVPLDIYENLVCHRQVVYSWNSFGVPLWLLAKQENYVKELFQKKGRNNRPSTSGDKKK